MNQLENTNTLFQTVKEVVLKAKKLAYRSSNAIMLNMYWEVGQLIVEDEQNGKSKAIYGNATLKNLSKSLTLEFGTGFDERNLNNMRAFYTAFPIWNAVRTELSWTHYRMISRIKNETQRLQYIDLSIEGNWDTRTLQRNIKTQYVGRILSSATTLVTHPKNIIKDPYILEFYGLPNDIILTEKKLENALINHIQQFLMELGKGFAFVARQQHIVTDTSDFYIDLVFYNYYLKCFVLIDLKTDKLSHADIGQIDMYVRMYDDLKKSADDNPTIGIILCTEKDDTIVKYSVLAENEQLFASKYRLYLPKEEELRQLIEQDRVIFELDNFKGE
ncbi:putative nuclease of restriction endonuclease-like (RecB) superfamily [Arcicella aurantiaca]|uniref:Putative nuclease of restriction endonuclease-like (RecB) superfamily n=1 Tax=Arcicella aurantiaca TaxID=591202 RepID=A0A316DZX1_9BACT|nr:PDDEXK nuclease domain-containing protein [Arcicella aurantiaca]PWK22968.1 putative nuclease of restriction endonuclease-like (RecB) superfamily [Arcicella aurantiaca]